MRILGTPGSLPLRLSLVAVIVITLSACGSVGGGGDFNLISIEEEWQLGNQLAADIARQMRIVNDPAAQAYLDRIGNTLVAQTKMANLPWNFHIVDDPAINAFNIPGGHVYVTTGLIGAAPNMAEFAGVMAHEIAHGVERHATQQISRQYGLSVLAGIVLGQNPAVYQQILAQVVGAGTLARFSREAERESDRLAVQYMHGAGIDPRGMASMFRILLAQSRQAPGRVERFFATHPLTEDRIRDVERAVQALPARTNLAMGDPGYDDMRRRVGRTS
jgi:beta-barrel assembly-enhancing protease